MSHNSYKGPDKSKLYKDVLFKQIRDYSDNQKEKDPPETRIVPTTNSSDIVQNPDNVKVTRSGQVYKTTILIYPTSILTKNVSQICSKRKILLLDPPALYAIQTAILNRMQLVKTETLLNPFEKFILGCGAENIFPQSLAKWGQNKECSHRKNVKFKLENKPKPLAVRYYRAPGRRKSNLKI